MENAYVANGYKDRADYLHDLADMFDVPYETVHLLADILGPKEDFDGLVTTLEDYC